MKNKTTKRYSIRNWREYNKALVGRGSLTLWVDARSLDTWLNTDQPARRGRRRIYTDVAILCSLMLREVYHLPLRATEGLISSLMRLMCRELPVPHYSTLSRRARRLKVKLPATSKGKPRHLVIDSSGLKVYGEGEWKVRLHGWSKRRTWRKLHIGVDEQTGEVLAALISERDLLDRQTIAPLLEQIEGEIRQVSADGAYDFKECYKVVEKRKARAVIPPRQDAVISGRAGFEQRDENLRQIRKLGIKQWKRQSNYHRRSLVETAFFRIKTIFGERLKARQSETQSCEARIKCAALNRMTQLGMPQTVAVK